MKKRFGTLLVSFSALAAHATLPDTPTFHLFNKGTETAAPSSIELWCKGSDGILTKKYNLVGPFTLPPGGVIDSTLPKGTLADGDWTCQMAVYFGTSRTWTNFTPILTVKATVRNYTLTGE